MKDQSSTYLRLRYTAAGALAALAAAGALAGASALGASPRAKTPAPAAVAARAADKAGAPRPTVNPQPFFNAVRQLVDGGTLTAVQGQAVDRQITAGRIDTDSLASSGFTQAQLQALQQAIGNVKRSLAPAGAAARGSKTAAATAADKSGAPRPAVTPQPFFDAVGQLVNGGTLTAAEGQAVDRQIAAGRIDTDSLASSGFTQAQLQALQQTLRNVKRSLVSAAAAGAAAGSKS